MMCTSLLTSFVTYKCRIDPFYAKSRTLFRSKRVVRFMGQEEAQRVLVEKT